MPKNPTMKFRCGPQETKLKLGSMTRPKRTRIKWFMQDLFGPDSFTNVILMSQLHTPYLILNKP
jgi:hypothetical protein